MICSFLSNIYIRPWSILFLSPNEERPPHGWAHTPILLLCMRQFQHIVTGNFGRQTGPDKSIAKPLNYALN